MLCEHEIILIVPKQMFAKLKKICDEDFITLEVGTL
jgi:hypothetical protein